MSAIILHLHSAGCVRNGRSFLRPGLTRDEADSHHCFFGSAIASSVWLTVCLPADLCGHSYGPDAEHATTTDQKVWPRRSTSPLTSGWFSWSSHVTRERDVS
jgi:hypothetical protein